MTSRRSLSTTARVRIFEDAGGLCHICGQKIQAGQKWDVEHVIPLAMGGEDGGDNLKPAHKACHGEKSRDDFGRIAKAKRQRAAHIGIRKRGGFQTNRDGKFKALIGGGIVPRHT